MRLPAVFFITLVLATVSIVLGCGVLPAGQASTRNFMVTGLTSLPVNMVHGGPTVPARVPGVGTSSSNAQGFVQRLVMQTVFDVLERQGRSALLPDVVISGILGQLTINITYLPMFCQEVLLGLSDMTKIDDAKPQNCIIIESTVTGICTMRNVNMMGCMAGKTAPIPPKHLSISGSLMTTNSIMANWSNRMWQDVVNRALRMLALGSFGSHFFSASITVGN
ncbi:hypothetical protein KIN20_033106 [Parelaphostrongylus tenuis]|uniref:Uncharacterized protein n=1 Tax=Parelaphostrongylus tenuis TaxID=148309 RepID=A0AAD5R7H1_PARTN|nr:hypothetical protein KIN20_033106 [Parelaphostrongylus tenuis]